MEDSATAPSPVPQPAGSAGSAAAAAAAAAAATASAGSADAYPSPPRSQSQQAQPASQQQQQQRQANAPVRILGRNVNGTVVQTSMPQNEAELQLYRVMQRASLLSYYDTLLEMGGDDVQQLCDAGEAEFLEIMALVGMASKPLHVRRLQKALQEWLTNPGMFQTPVMVPTTSSVSGSSSAGKTSATPGIAPVVFPCIGSYSPNSRQQIQSSNLSANMSANMSAAALSSISSQSLGSKLHAGGSSSSMVAGLPVAAAATPPSVPCSSHSASPAAAAGQLLGQFSAASGCCPIQRRRSLSPQSSSLQPYAGMQMPAASSPAEALPTSVATTSSAGSTLASTVPLSHSPGIMQVGNYESSSCGSQGTTPSPNSNSAMINAPQSPTMGLQSTPILLESQVQRLAEAAERLAATLRPLNPKPQSGIKKKMCKNLEMVMAMPDSDPRRMEEIRKYAAIYGRFDCKRKPEKPLTLHEVSVNEAAAQICRFVPALLTRRDELFPLARRVVRDSGHYYTKGLLHSSCNTSPRTLGSRENGEGDLSGGDETVPVGGADASKRRKLELRCEDEQENSTESTQQQQQQQQQAESARSKCSSYARGTLALDSDGNSIQIQQNRHRKRQRRRRPSRLHKSISSPVWQSCSDNSMVLEGVVEELEDSDRCYSSFEDDWDDCNEDDCENNFEIDTDDGAGDDDAEEASVSASIMHDVQSRVDAEKGDVSCVIDKENDFNLKVIASCGDNIIAVANPALMNRNQPAAITKEQPIKEEIPLRDRRD